MSIHDPPRRVVAGSSVPFADFPILRETFSRTTDVVSIEDAPSKYDMSPPGTLLITEKGNDAIRIIATSDFFDEIRKVEVQWHQRVTDMKADFKRETEVWENKDKKKTAEISNLELTLAAEKRFEKKQEQEVTELKNSFAFLNARLLELEQGSTSLKSEVKQLQAANEQLRAANEQLRATNGQLQDRLSRQEEQMGRVLGAVVELDSGLGELEQTLRSRATESRDIFDKFMAEPVIPDAVKSLFCDASRAMHKMIFAPPDLSSCRHSCTAIKTELERATKKRRLDYFPE